MRIGIISDTHDQLARTGLAARMLADAGAETLIHCGDLTRPDVVELFALLPTYFVFGNNDYEESALKLAMAQVDGVCLGRGAEVALGGKRIAVTHGDSPTEMRRLVRLQPDYLLFGHTHVALDQREGSTRFINPGALHRALEYSVALLDLSDDRLLTMTIDDIR